MKNKSICLFSRKLLFVSIILGLMMAIPGCQHDVLELEPELEPEEEIQADVIQESLKVAVASIITEGVLPSGAKYCILIPDACC